MRLRSARNRAGGCQGRGFVVSLVGANFGSPTRGAEIACVATTPAVAPPSVSSTARTQQHDGSDVPRRNDRGVAFRKKRASGGGIDQGRCALVPMVRVPRRARRRSVRPARPARHSSPVDSFVRAARSGDSVARATSSGEHVACAARSGEHVARDASSGEHVARAASSGEHVARAALSGDSGARSAHGRARRWSRRTHHFSALVRSSRIHPRPPVRRRLRAGFGPA